MKNFIKFLLRSHFVFRLNKSTRFIDFLNYSSEENSQPKRWLIKKMTFFKSRVKKQDGLLLFQVVKDYEYMLKMAAASKVYSEEMNLKVAFYNPYWMKWIGWEDKVVKMYKNFFTSSLMKMHKKFGTKLIFDAELKFKDQEKVQNELKYITQNLNTIEDIFNISIIEIKIGELIYDTYLRFFNLPTIEDIRDKRLISIIEIAINIALNFENVILKKNIKCLFNTYTSYIGHGITTRLCLKHNIPVYVFGMYTEIIQKVEKDNPYHCSKHWNFSPNKEIESENIIKAEKLLKGRFSGEIDSAVFYMNQTSFQETTLNKNLSTSFKEKKRNVVLYSHDFYDSPHVNRSLLFNDLYQFLNETLKEMVFDTQTQYWIKIHPNGIGDCKERTIDLVNSFDCSHFKILDDSVSNLNIIELKPDLIVTARGTVAMEMAFFEIPVVALYDNPYVNFNFAHTCYDLESFYSIIKGEKTTEINFDKNLIYSFYYQAYLEKLENIDIEIFNLLQNFKGVKFSDKYIEMLNQNEERIFADDFVSNYRRKLFQLD